MVAWWYCDVWQKYHMCGVLGAEDGLLQNNATHKRMCNSDVCKSWNVFVCCVWNVTPQCKHSPLDGSGTCETTKDHVRGGSADNHVGIGTLNDWLFHIDKNVHLNMCIYIYIWWRQTQHHIPNDCENPPRLDNISYLDTLSVKSHLNHLTSQCDNITWL